MTTQEQRPKEKSLGAELVPMLPRRVYGGKKAWGAVALAAIAGGGLLLRHHAAPVAVTVPSASVGGTAHGSAGTAVPSVETLTPKAAVLGADGAADAYNAGRFQDAEAQALRVIQGSQGAIDLAQRKTVVWARYVLAYATARRRDYRLSRARFAALQAEAAKLPDHGAREKRWGEADPDMEEEGAYEHAVLTSALGDHGAAEREFARFMVRYPQSPLINGAVQRIERFHHGNLPAPAMAAWKAAERITAARQHAEALNEAMCGPACLAELLRRRGEHPDVKRLAKEMGTSEAGTSLKALATAAGKHGYRPRGVQATLKGLKGQRLPAIAFVTPGHYVVVDKASWLGVTAWDPGRDGTKGATRWWSNADWQKRWRGATLLLR